jgi:peptide/nickel transport system ATP-binding protein
LLKVRNLSIEYRSRKAPPCRAVNEVGFDLPADSILGLVGESGCGKTTLALALLGIFHPAASVVSGSIRFRDRELLGADERVLRSVRGAAVSMVFQEAALALNPVMRAGDQVSEVVRAHSWDSSQQCRKKAEAALAAVQLADKRFYSARPHQLSAGQRQRVAIAQALVCEPSLLIADEPTSALDNTTQAEILTLLKELKRHMRLAILFITHNPELLPGFADRVLIMYAGSVVEEGTSSQIVGHPNHPYTASLMRCIPPLPEQPSAHLVHLPAILDLHGSAPAVGCPFQPRCPVSVGTCGTSWPSLSQLADGGSVRCFRYG